MNNYRSIYSVSVYGDRLVYYFGILRTIYDLPNRNFIIHTTEKYKDLFNRIASDQKINIDSVIFNIHQEPKTSWHSCLWRYDTILMDYDIVNIIDSDVNYSNLDKYYNSWYYDYIDCDYLVMHLCNSHKDFMCGLSSFRLSKIDNHTKNLIVNILNSSKTYADDEKIIWKFLKPILKYKGVLYTHRNNDKNKCDFKKYQVKQFRYNDYFLRENDLKIFKLYKVNNMNYKWIDKNKVYSFKLKR